MAKKIESKYVLSTINTIDALILGELGALIYPSGNHKAKLPQTAPFIKFLPIAVAIEFLGACFDEQPFDEDDLSEKRFNKALKLLGKKYDSFAKAGSDRYLYKKFRCGMSHQLRPKEGVAFTTRIEAIEDHNKHLVKDEEGTLVLVLEDFYDDLAKAARKIMAEFKSGKITNKKGEKGYLSITKYLK